MSLGLPNTKFSANQPIQRLGLSSRQHKVAPSIAEQAIFIPKPHDRVEFKLSTGGGDIKPMPALGEKKPAESIPLPGSGNSKDGPKGTNIARGELGANGLTARFDTSAWKGAPGGYVEVQVNMTPEKQTSISNDPIPTQEEGRQVNHKEINFTQQYDAYGRPRIGFSREPYDFAATKFVSVTSQVAFQANMAEMHQEFNKYLLTNKQPETASAPEPSLMGEENAQVSSEPSVMGQENAQVSSEPALMGEENAQVSSEPTVMGQEDTKKGSGEIPIFGSTSDNVFKTQDGKDSEGGAEDKGVSAEESFEKQKVSVQDTFMNDAAAGMKTSKAGSAYSASLSPATESGAFAAKV
ncbi:MAG: hypothetical protein HY751_00130 [Nitrospinae bacterium]|nr:hypothetical protein [Nitrospinota bacterium]